MTGGTIDDVGLTERQPASTAGLGAMGGLAGMMGGMGGMGGMSGMGGMWMTTLPLVLLTVAALLVIAYVAVRQRSADEDGGDATATPEEDPIERLKRRYAEGELTEAEFERALDRELEGGTTESSVGGSDVEDDGETIPARPEQGAEP